MFIRKSNSCIQTRDVFCKLNQMFELRTAASQDDSAIQHLIIQTDLFEMVSNKIKNLIHPCLYDVGKIFNADLLGWHSAQAGDRNVCVCFGFVGQCTSEL